MFTLDASSIDKSLPVPVGTQLHGLLAYMLSFGDIPHGAKLPSVRTLAADIGIAPMTVAQVYKQLRDEGLVEMRQGLGAFAIQDPKIRVAGSNPLDALRADIGGLIEKADNLGISTLSLISMINAQSQFPRGGGDGLSIVFVCIFEGPGRDYVEQIRPVLAPEDKVRLITLEGLTGSDTLREACRKADLVLTFVNREAEVRSHVDSDNLLGLRFIPSEQTRQNLARLDPRTKVAAITHFKEYIAIMRPSVREFAPHVSDIRVTWSSAPDLDETLAQCNAVIFASGADHVAEHVPEHIPCFEYRHAPDPGAVENVLAPHLADIRRQKARGLQASHPSQKVAARPKGN
ncbi:GntR family transcriptional regulator [Pelagibacterium sp.]|uniref:GntR family transcriptional regulator n=1 Tax=Pelagibacterium sp. TaxID=1967288 RepID=UPI003BAB65F5